MAYATSLVRKQKGRIGGKLVASISPDGAAINVVDPVTNQLLVAIELNRLEAGQLLEKLTFDGQVPLPGWLTDLRF